MQNLGKLCFKWSFTFFTFFLDIYLEKTELKIKVKQFETNYSVIPDISPGKMKKKIAAKTSQNGSIWRDLRQTIQNIPDISPGKNVKNEKKEKKNGSCRAQFARFCIF